MVLHLINSNVYRVNDYRQSKRLEAMVSKSPLFHFVGSRRLPGATKSSDGTKSRHSGRNCVPPGEPKAPLKFYNRDLEVRDGCITTACHNEL